MPAALALAMLAAQQAWSATYVLPSDDALIRKADAIVRGWVEDVEGAETSKGAIETRVTVAVDRVLKGNVSSRTVTIHQPGGQVGDRLEVYPGIGSFQRGEEVLLMLESLPGGDYRLTDFGVGKFSVRIATDGTKLLRRDALTDALVLSGSSGSTVQGGASAPDPDRDALGFEEYIEDLIAGVPAEVGYAVPPSESSESTGGGLHTEFSLFPNPARWLRFADGRSVTLKDNATGDSGTNCPTGCHDEVAAGVQAWNGATDALISVLYGGTDSTIGSKAFSSLTNQVQFNDPHDEIPNLLACSGMLAMGGYSATAGGGGTGCPEKGNPSFNRITAGRILVNNGVGSCMNSCNYKDMIAHETGHTIGADHSSVAGSLMAATLVYGRCGVLQTDDLSFAHCVYPGSSSCVPAVVASVIPKIKYGILRAVVQGSGFRKHSIVQIDAGGGFVPAPTTVFRRKTKVVGKDVEAIWPAGVPVDVRVMSPTGCPSNAITVTR